MVLFFIGLPQAFGAETALPPQENLKLHSFKIVGNKIVKTAEIKKELSEKRPFALDLLERKTGLPPG